MMVQKLRICGKVYFDQLLNFQILLLLFLHTLLLYILLFGCLIFSKPLGCQTVGSRSGLTFCQAWSGSKLFAKIISRQQKSPVSGKRLETKQLFETTFWLKPWQKLHVISFGSNFFHLAKVLVLFLFGLSVGYNKFSSQCKPGTSIHYLPLIICLGAVSTLLATLQCLPTKGLPILSDSSVCLLLFHQRTVSFSPVNDRARYRGDLALALLLALAWLYNQIG